MNTYYEDRRLSDDGYLRPQDGRERSMHEPWPEMTTNWMEDLSGARQWDELAAEIGQESQARVALAGLANVGKSVLFNRLRGWVISLPSIKLGTQQGLQLETLGMFVLADLPEAWDDAPEAGIALLLALGEPSLVVYVLDATVGVRQTDFRWIAALRASGRPMVVVLNKYDLARQRVTTAVEAEQQLGMPVIPISALTGLNVEDRLLPALLDAAPKLAVPLGREIIRLRRVAARRVIRQAALFAGVMGAQPIPILDLPFQAMLQTGVVMRVGAAYGYPPTGGVNREVAGTALGALGLRYLAQAAAKFVPILGWAVACALSAATTFLLGEAAIRYYESGRAAPLRDFLHRRRGRMSNWIDRLRRRKPVIDDA